MNPGNDGDLSDSSQAASRDWSLGHSEYPSPQVYPPNPHLRLFCCVRSGEGRFWSTVSETSTPPSCIQHCHLPTVLHHPLPLFHLPASSTSTFPPSCIIHHCSLHQLLLFPPDYITAPSVEWSSERQAEDGKEKVNLWLKVQL